MRVIDISKHQGTFDPVKAKQNGVEAVMLRLAYSTAEDTRSMSWADSISENGMNVGGYGFGTWHYLEKNGGSIAKAVEIMEKEVTAWIAVAKKHKINWWFAIDQELEINPATKQPYHMGLTMMDNTMILNRAIKMVKDAGFSPLVYCSVSWDYNYIHTNSLDTSARYWFAFYGNETKNCKLSPPPQLTQLPSGKYRNWMANCLSNGRLAGWQFGGGSGSLGSFYGCGSEHVDRNVFYLVPTTDKPVSLFKVKTGEMTKGDLQAVENLLKERLIEYEVTQ